VLDQEVTPCPQAGHRVQVVQVVALSIKDGVGLIVDDRAHQRLLVLEVVVDLRPADPGGRPDVLQGGFRHPVVEHQPRRRGDDPLPGLTPPLGQRPPGAGS
jgi:hypothetical protein